MASRVQEDFFTEDADETCPLCVEEFDLSDKNFRPCPCGYQVCQFCYHNIKNNVNGLCPACRRPYDDSSIEYKAISAEEQRADNTNQARKKALARKKETEQRQTESTNTKTLAGRRVVQKNLVYVVGLSQQTNQEDFLKTLRGSQYFGQYGKIIKIVVSRAKVGTTDDKSVAIYVTFERREDAARCIAAVNGPVNVNSQLRAQYGTTKYCSAYLRGESCTNRNCTFLHEIGEETDSFSRADLSSMNAMSSQRPTQPSASQAVQGPPHAQGPPQQATQSLSAAMQHTQPMIARTDSAARSDSPDTSALPSSASWATRNLLSDASKSSKPGSVVAPSPVVAHAQPAASSSNTRTEIQCRANTNTITPDLPSIPSPKWPASPFRLERALRVISVANFDVTYDRSQHSEQFMKEVDHFPQLFDPDGGLKRFQLARELEKERLKQEEERNVIGAMSTAEDDEALASGSLQLGGEPDPSQAKTESDSRLPSRSRSTAQPTTASPVSAFPFASSAFSMGGGAGLSQSLSSQQQQQQQQQQASLTQRASSIRQSPTSQGILASGYGQTSSLHQHQTSNPFQTPMQNAAIFNAPQPHARQLSRYTFGNESSLAPGAVKPAANPQLSQQQAGVLPAAHGKAFHGQQFQQGGTPSLYTGVHGPPPGLKSSGTPPISGGGMFGQGHGFASAMGGAAGFGGMVGNTTGQDDVLQRLLQRERGNSMQGSEPGKQPPRTPVIPVVPVAGQATEILPPTTNASNLHIAKVPKSSRQEISPTSLAPAIPSLSLAQDFPSLPAASKVSASQPVVSAPQRKVAVSKQTSTNPQPAVPKSSTITASTSILHGESKPQEFRSEHTSSITGGQHASNSPTKQLAEKKDRAKAKQAKGHVENLISGKMTKEDTLESSKTGASTQETVPHVLAASHAEQDVSNIPMPPRPNTPLASSLPVGSTFTSGSKAGISKQSLTPSRKESLANVTPSPSTVTRSRDVSRRPSVSSTFQPGTPHSERISDNASYTSTSLSRANSPPAPVRGTSSAPRVVSKAQQKKDRQARAKQLEEVKVEQNAAPKSDEAAVIQEPIVGRKKKTRKSKGTGTRDSTPAPTRPSSPEPRTVDRDGDLKAEPPVPPLPGKDVRKHQHGKAGTESRKANIETSRSAPPAPNVTEEDILSKTLTPAAIFASLSSAGALDPSITAEYFKTFSSMNTRFETSPDLASLGDPLLSDRQRQELDDGLNVVTEDYNGRFCVVLSCGRIFRGFTETQANRFSDLCYRYGLSSFRRENMEHLPQARLAGSDTPRSRSASGRHGYTVDPAQPSENVGLETALASKLPSTALTNRFATELSQPTLSSAAASSHYSSARTVNGAIISMDEAEMKLLGSRKETEILEKKLNALLKKNRRLILGGGH